MSKSWVLRELFEIFMVLLKFLNLFVGKEFKDLWVDRFGVVLVKFWRFCLYKRIIFVEF